MSSRQWSRSMSRMILQPRYLSSLGSPMFPERKLPELADLMDNAAGQSKPKGKIDDDDFLSNHGGKVALIGFALTVGLIYRWVKNGSNKNDAEKEIRNSFPVDPAEISDIRHSNSITQEEFLTIVRGIPEAFPSGAASYSEFIKYVRSSLGRNINYGHILDRIVLSQVKRATNGEYPTVFLLVALSTAERERAEIRIRDMYQICLMQSRNSDSSATASCGENDMISILDNLIAAYQVDFNRKWGVFVRLSLLI
jgi:hypothetical protein